MGHKKVCLSCRKAFSIDLNNRDEVNLTCPDCGGTCILLPHRFRPPGKSEIKKWQVAEFLINNGFPYHHVYEDRSGKPNEGLAVYPETLEGAKEFIIKYKDQSKLRDNKNT